MSTQMHILSRLEDGILAQESELRLYHINKPIATPQKDPKVERNEVTSLLISK